MDCLRGQSGLPLLLSMVEADAPEPKAKVARTVLLQMGEVQVGESGVAPKLRARMV